MGRRPDHRIPVPLVLAAASAMICIGLVQLYLATDEEQAPRPDVTVKLDTRTPEATAESFLDAWRKRAHAEALKLSVGPARRRVRKREREDRDLDDRERELKRQVWDRMARARLALRIDESEKLSEHQLILRGTAEGRFVGNDYQREVGFVVVQREDGWRVTRMKLGEILTDLPDFLKLGHLPPGNADRVQLLERHP